MRRNPRHPDNPHHPIVRRLGTLALASALAATVFACQSSDSTSNLIPMPVTGTPVTETFSGTVPVGVGQADVHNFNVMISGTVSVILTAAGPPPTIFMGVGIGNPSSTGSSTCVLLSGGSVSAQAGPTAILSGTVVAGSYCVVVSDIGNATAPVTYTVSVTHT
jgi:hypothetical protein